MGTFNKDIKTTYNLNKEGNGVYVFILKGNATINNQLVENRDGFGIWNISNLEITSNEDATEILVMEVPMSV